MSPYHHYNQQPSDLQINGIHQQQLPPQANQSSITNASSNSLYSSAFQTRASNCTTNQNLNIPFNRNQSQPTIDQTHRLANNIYPNNLSHSFDVYPTNYFHPSTLNNNNVNSNVLANNFSEENSMPSELANPNFLNYPDQRLITNNHNMVRKHRSLPADSFNREVNFYPNNKYPPTDQVHSRSSSFKLPVS